MQVKLPNVRKLFIPDPGYYICDTDLDRADLQVVVWEADDKDLKRQLRLGVDLHIMNGILIEGKEPPPEDELIETHSEYPEHKQRFKAARVFAKAFVHGTNYGGKAPTMGRVAGIITKQAEVLQARWFALHPGIKDWHERVEHALMTTRTVRNAFGFRRVYFGRVESLLPEALAWIPQSTVAIVTDAGWQNIDRELPEIQVLLQVHDSLVWQILRRDFPSKLQQIKSCLEIEIPYPDPLIIPVGLKASLNSWGECKDYTWEGVRK